MTAPAAEAGPGRSPLAAGWGRAGLAGLAAFGVLAALAALIALGVAMSDLPGLSLGETLRIGGLYVTMFHRVPVRFSAADTELGRLLDPAAGAGVAGFHAELAIAPLAGTAIAIWLLWRAGARVARSVGGTQLERALHGAKIAPAYAVAVFLVSLVSRVEVSRVQEITSGLLEIWPSALHAFGLAFAVSGVTGAAGGWWTSSDGSEGGRLRGTLAGGWTMLVAGIGLAYAGLVLVGIVRPEGPEAGLTPTTGGYYRVVFDRPDVGSVVLLHHLALAPNEGVWALTPAMGGCLGVFPDTDVPDRFLCYGRFPREVVGLAPPPSAWLRPSTWLRLGDAPAAYLLFLFAPAVATLLGGWRAVSAAGDTSAIGRAVLLGAGAGLVYSTLLALASWAGSVSAWGSLTVGRATDEGAARVGPDLRATVLLSLAWGVGGGGLGAALRAVTRRRRTARPGDPRPG